MTIHQPPPPPVPNHNRPASQLTKLESVTTTIVAGLLAGGRAEFFVEGQEREAALDDCRRVAMEILK